MSEPTAPDSVVRSVLGAPVRAVPPGLDRLRPEHPLTEIDQLAQLAARLLGAPSALVSWVEPALTRAVGVAGLPADVDAREVPSSESLCAATTASGKPLAIPDTAADARFEAIPAVHQGVVRSFLGVPVRTAEGAALGAMCVFGPDRRSWTHADVDMLTEISRAVVGQLELVAQVREHERVRARTDLAITAAGIGTFAWDFGSRRFEWDAPLRELFGLADGAGSFDGRVETFLARLHPDDAPGAQQTMQAAVDTVGDFECEYRVRFPDGRERLLQSRGSAVGADGVTERILGAAWDVTATRAAEERAARIVATMPVGYLAVSAAGAVTAVNNVAERLLRRERRAVLGRPLREVWSFGGGQELLAACSHVQGGAGARTLEVAATGASVRWLEAQVWSEPRGVAIYLTDVTDRRQAQDAARVVADRDRAIAAVLQDAMLSELPQPDHLQIAARYRTATAHDRVGGDWYDAVVQPGGATTLVVGDVIGHDIAAAAVMGQLRSMLRAFMWRDDDPPGTQLDRLDRAVRSLHPGVLATVVAARIEQSAEQHERSERTLRWANAGHPPPVLVDPAGGVRLLRGPSPDLLVGVRGAVLGPRHDLVEAVPAGSLLLLYTDGLVERRDEDLEAGFARLGDSLAAHRHEPLPVLLDSVIAEVAGRTTADDVVVLAVRFAPEDV